VTRVGGITDPAGAFSGCLCLEDDLAEMSMAARFCPGTGLVRHNAAPQGTPYGSQDELISYRVR
jgi:hypothetical protein